MDFLLDTFGRESISHDAMLAGRMFAAAIAAALMGTEREWRGKAAGLRTHIIVSLGAATFTMVSLELAARAGDAPIDPTRALQGVVGGIGFLGAGQILHARGDVRGITTAAGIWLTGGVGVACGAGEFFIAFLAVLGALIAYTVVGAFERRVLDGMGPDAESERR